MASDDRAARRRAARDAARRAPTAIMYSPTGSVIDTTGRLGRRPVIVPGQHCWMAFAQFQLTDEHVAAAQDPHVQKFLDQENLLDIMIGCYVCEEPLGTVEPGSPCPGDPAQGPAT